MEPDFSRSFSYPILFDFSFKYKQGFPLHVNNFGPQAVTSKDTKHINKLRIIVFLHRKMKQHPG